MLIILGVIGGIIVIVGFALLSIYNRLVALRNNRNNAFADIDVQLTQRFDLVPNLVNTVKGYTQHEKETLEQVTAARTSFMNATNVDQKLGAENQLAGALKSLFAVAENYPDLKANQNFLQLQQELSDIENKIAAARRYFNSATREYNTTLQSFPANLIAPSFGFAEAAYYQVDEPEQRARVDVEF